MNDKPKLNFENLYKRLDDKGIAFPNHTSEQVQEILRTRSYYYKLASYRKNFPKNSDGKYQNLTFDALLKTASIDVYLRELLLDMCLDIEHTGKTHLMTLITDNEQEDGYSLVSDFEQTFPDKYKEIISHFQKSSYKKDMFNKRTEISIWVFLEIIDFGAFIMLAELYFKKYPEQPSIYQKQYKFVKNIRNTCAHNNVFLINLFDKNDHIPRPDGVTKSYASTMKLNLGLVHYPKIVDITNLFYLHKQLCSKELNRRRHNEAEIILDKFEASEELYNTSTPLPKFFNSIFQKCVDFLIKSWYP